jgi:hypothetical protein
LEKLINENYPVVLGRRPTGRDDWFMGHPDRKKDDGISMLLSAITTK